jgi:hypothetical protein
MCRPLKAQLQLPISLPGWMLNDTDPFKAITKGPKSFNIVNQEFHARCANFEVSTDKDKTMMKEQNDEISLLTTELARLEGQAEATDKIGGTIAQQNEALNNAALNKEAEMRKLSLAAEQQKVKDEEQKVKQAREERNKIDGEIFEGAHPTKRVSTQRDGLQLYYFGYYRS